MARKKTVKLSNLISDDKNFNIGSPLGKALLNKSMSKLGAGRSVLIDKNNRIIAGNKSVEAAIAVGMENVQIIESDGKRIIAVKRTDIDLDTPEGRELALADNITAKESIVIDADLVEATVSEAVCEEWGINTSTGEVYNNEKSKKENLEPFKRTHVLLSFHPQVMLKIQSLIQQIIDTEGVEYEQASN